MPAQTLEQILGSLSSVYDPQVQAVQQQQALIPQQLQADESALQGQQKNAFDDIFNGARRRGTGVALGGIPLGEQANYTATTFLPAMANLRNTYATKNLSLVDALNSINERKLTNANSLYQFGQQQDLAERQFQEQQAQAKAAQAAAFNPTLGGNQATPGAAASAPTATTQKNLTGNKSQQEAYNAIKSLLLTNNGKLIQQTVNAIAASARNGNTYDQYKLQLISNPDWVKTLYQGTFGVPTNAGNGITSARF